MLVRIRRRPEAWRTRCLLPDVAELSRPRLAVGRGSRSIPDRVAGIDSAPRRAPQPKRLYPPLVGMEGGIEPSHPRPGWMTSVTWIR